MATPTGFETAAAVLVQAIAAHNVEVREKLLPIKSSDAANAANILKPWYKAALDMVSKTQDPIQSK